MMTKTRAACAALGALWSLCCASAVAAQETKVSWKGAPEFSHGEWKFKPRGRVFLDFVHQDVEGGASVADLSADNTRIRTARLGVQGSWSDKFAYVAEASIANGEAQWEDLVLEYTPSETTTFANWPEPPVCFLWV